jgi:drug/metabolite transporter (DMT)-like permease
MKLSLHEEEGHVLKQSTSSTIEVLPETHNIRLRLRKFYGVFLAFTTAFLGSIMIILVKKASMLNGIDQNFIRYSSQLVITGIFIYYKKIDLGEHWDKRGILLSRAVVGVIGLMASYTAVSLTHPSDSTALANSSIVLTAVVSRFLFKEKFTPVHVVSIVMACAGVVLISQPTFIFKSQSRPIATNSTSSLETEQHASTLRVIGLGCSCVHAIAATSVTILVKKLSDQSVHFSLNVFYTSLLGSPLAFLISLVLVLTNNSQLVYNLTENFSEFKFHLMYSVLSGLVGTTYQMMFSLCLKYEDASKFSIIKTSDLFFIFILQYLLLGIKSNLFKIVGGVLIFLSGAGVLTIKIFDAKRNNSSSSPDEVKRKKDFSRILFFKF